MRCARYRPPPEVRLAALSPLHGSRSEGRLVDGCGIVPTLPDPLEPPIQRSPVHDMALADVTLLLADSAQVAEGKLFVLGGGLQLIGPLPQPVSIALIIHSPWDRAEIQHDWMLELLDQDGIPVMHNEQPVTVAGTYQAHRAVGIVAGSPLLVPIAINFSALPVQPGGRYTWRLAINGTSEEGWQLSFSVRPAPAETT
jgi:hypothetical protein